MFFRPPQKIFKVLATEKLTACTKLLSIKIASNARTSLEGEGFLWRCSIHYKTFNRHSACQIFHTQVKIIATSHMVDPKISRRSNKNTSFPKQVICLLSSTQLHFSVFNSRYFSVPNFITSQFHPMVVQPPSHLAIPEPLNIVFLLALQE